MKQCLLNDLTELLEQDSRLTANGKLVRNKVITLALNMDAELINLLLNNEKVQQYFFVKAGNAWVFDKIRFQQFINNKEFLPDSYTIYRNRIGLTTDDKFVTQGKEVVLSWPYKDAVLEGGQTKDEQSRKEIFWHEMLAAEEIDLLLQPKALGNICRYDETGRHTPTSLSFSDNFIVRGNNLLAMHSLKPVFAGKVKLIYIDPPYNTGSDSFLYNDSFNHATWLTFMKNRLEIAWQLLAPDGCIFIQVDDTEAAYLKVLCDELFGRENFKENIILKSSTESGVNAINVKRGERLFKVKEHIFFYAKSPSFRFKPFYTKTAYNINYRYEVVKDKAGYNIRDLKKAMADNGEDAFINYALKHPEHIYSLEKNIKKAGEKFKAFAAANKPKGIVEPFINSSGDIVLIYDGGVLVPLHERIITENGKNFFGVLASDLWVDIGTTAAGEGGIAFNNGKKPEKLLKRIIEMTTQPGDLVLDYHLGSGTTAAVAHKLGRRYIGIEQMDYGENDSVVRLQNVISGEASGISKTVDWKGGGSFIYCELIKLNEFFAEKILALKSDNDATELLALLREKGFISYDMDKALLPENKAAFKALSLADKQQAMMQFLDLNFLYLPYTEIADVDFGIDKKTQTLNQQFYNLNHHQHVQNK